MLKIYKNINIALIFMLTAGLLCPGSGYPNALRVPVGQITLDRVRSGLWKLGEKVGKDVNGFPDVITLQNVKTGESFELRKIKGKNEYALFIDDIRIVGSKFTFYDTPRAIIIDDIFVQGHSNASYQFTSQGIGSTVLSYLYNYARDRGKDLHIYHTRNYALIRLCNSLSTKARYFIDDEGKYFHEVDWLRDFGPITISISDEYKWIWEGQFSLRIGTEAMAYNAGSSLIPDKKGLGDKIVVTNQGGRINVRWKDPHKKDEIYFQVNLGERVDHIEIPTTREIIIPSTAIRACP